MYGGHTGKERYIPRHIIANKISPSVCECLPAVQLLSGCATTCSVNRKGKRPTQNWFHVQTCNQIKKTFHEYNLDDSVDVARSYALLLYGKTGRDVDTFDELRYAMAMTTDKSGTMLPPYEGAFKEHVLCAKCHAFIWCTSQIPNQELIELVGHSWSACDDGLITPIMHNLLPLRFET